MRVLAVLLVLLVSGATPARGANGTTRVAVDPLGACQQALTRATRQLGDGIRRQVGKCIAAGMRCLTTASTDPTACCAAATPRCRVQERKLARARGRLVGRIATGRCASLPVATILDPAGLGFASAAETCRCLPEPTNVSDLASLATCLGDLVDLETTRVLAIAESPRAAEALVCVGLDREVGVLATSDVATACHPPDETPTPAGATPTLAATPGGATPLATPTSRPRRTPAPAPSASPTVIATRTPSGDATATAQPTLPPRATATPARTAVAATPSAQRSASPTATSTPVAVCGNGIVEGDEQCDRNAYDNSGCIEDVCTCDDFCDDVGGHLACARDCTIDFSHCTAGGCEF